MKTKKITRLLRPVGLAMTAGFVMLALGCSDGELPAQAATPQITVVPPTCKSFTATPDTIDRGGSATLAWEVEGADKVEIAASGTSSFSFSTQEQFSGSTMVSDIQETTTFILTATKLPPVEGEAEGEELASGMMVEGDSSRSALRMTRASALRMTKAEEEGEEVAPTTGPQICRLTARVTVAGPAVSLSVEQFYAEDPEVDAGEETVLIWSVVPEDAQVDITGSTGEKPVLLGMDCEISGELNAIEQELGEVPTIYPASGCASVGPMEDTTYTLTATAGGETSTPPREVIVVVVKQPEVIYFKADGSTSLTVPSYSANITLSWKVRPAAAKVTIAASAAVDGTLPENVSSEEGEGEATVTVRQDTTFTITASVEGEEDASAQVLVVSDLSGLDCSQFMVAAPQSPVFSGEMVKVYWSLPAQASGLIPSVRIGGETFAAAQGVAEVGAGGSYNVEFLTSDGATFCSTSVSAPVATFDGPSGAKAVRVVEDPSDPTRAYVGLDQGFNGGVIEVVHYPDVDNPMNIKFFDALKDFDEVAGSFNTRFMERDVKDFPVNAIAKLSDGRLLVATTGVILVENPTATEEKEKWKALTVLLRADTNDDYPGEHPSCAGKPQHGRNGGVSGDIDTMGQVCDMVVDGDKLYFATDRGLYSINNVDSFLSRDEQADWRAQREGNPTYGKVVNDLLLDGSTLYVAGSMGLYKYEGGWSEQLLSGTVYSVAVSGTDEEKTLVAGMEGSSVKVKRGDGEWEDVDLCVDGTCPSRAFSVVADSYAQDVIYVGTDGGGFYVSRDRGLNFSLVSLGTLEGDVRSIVALYFGDPTAEPVGFCLYLATDSGVMKADLADVMVGLPEQPVPTLPEEPAAEEEASSEDEVVTAVPDFDLEVTVRQP